MEFEVCKMLNFRLNYPEPTAFLFYYLRHQGLDNDLVKLSNMPIEFVFKCCLFPENSIFFTLSTGLLHAAYRVFFVSTVTSC